MLATILVLAGLAAAYADEKATAQAGPTLYKRIGGYDKLAAIVDDFLVQLRNDKAFARFGGGRSAGSLKRTRQLLVDQLCEYSKGPCIYIGRDMKPAHEGLKITTAEWEAQMKYWVNSLDKLKVDEPEKGEFLKLIEETRKDIVELPEKK